MTDHDYIESPRDEALRKIGRNVVNFQKIETLLKVLVLWSRFEGSVHSIKKVQSDKEKRLRNRPLGDVASKFSRNIIKGDGGGNGTVDPSADLSILFEFKLDIDCETAAKQRKELQDLVTERNRLVHRELANIDFESDESCRNLITMLDEQNERVRKKYAQFAEIWKFNVQARKEIAAYLNSDKFLAYFQREPNGT